jgi:hypothetical protein
VPKTCQDCAKNSPSPASDSGRFELRIRRATAGRARRGPRQLPSGSYCVSELLARRATRDIARSVTTDQRIRQREVSSTLSPSSKNLNRRTFPIKINRMT